MIDFLLKWCYYHYFDSINLKRFETCCATRVHLCSHWRWALTWLSSLCRSSCCIYSICVDSGLLRAPSVDLGRYYTVQLYELLTSLALCYAHDTAAPPLNKPNQFPVQIQQHEKIKSVPNSFTHHQIETTNFKRNWTWKIKKKVIRFCFKIFFLTSFNWSFFTRFEGLSAYFFQLDRKLVHFSTSFNENFKKF